MRTKLPTTPQFTGGAGLDDETAQRVGGFLWRTFGERPITAEDVVDKARPLNSPIHDRFEWDDARAAHEHRLEQARHLLRTIKVIITNGASQETRAFHHVKVIEKNGEARKAYVSQTVVWRTPDLAEQVRDQALRELQSWTARYRQYQHLTELVDRVDQLLLAETV